MRVLITGSDGQLGTDLCKVLNNHTLIPLTIKDGDICDFSFVSNQFNRSKPDVIINTAAYVRVDDCEDNKELAFQVNAIGARNVAVVAEKLGSKLVHISTDYVFGGETAIRYVPYTEFDEPIPCNLYGRSKLAGEKFVIHLCSKHMIVRSSALFGTAGAMGKGGNFIETILRIATENKELRVVNDQIFSPTFTHDLALRISQLIETDYYGTFHVTNSGICSWYEFAVQILAEAGYKNDVIPITSAQFPQKAARPRYSVLDNFHCRLLKFSQMRDWKSALKEYFVQRGYTGK